MTTSENYLQLKYYFSEYIKEYEELEGLTDEEVERVFTDMMIHWYHVAETYLGD